MGRRGHHHSETGALNMSSPGSIIFTLGPIVVRWYGVMIALGFIAATYFAHRLAKGYAIDPEKIVNCILISFIGGIIGGRLYFVALEWPTFALHPENILATWQGGLSIHGGMIGCVLAAYAYCHFNKIPFLKALDIGGIVVSLGQAIGRWGNFFNNECFGGPVDPSFPLKLYIPESQRPIQFQNESYFHPAFLYESVWDLLVFFLLYFYLGKKLRAFPGVTFMVYLALYSIGRLLIEPLRTDSIMKFGVQVPVVASIVCLVVAVVAIVFLMSKYKRSAKT